MCDNEMCLNSDIISEEVCDQVGFRIDIYCKLNKHPLARKSVVLGRDQSTIYDRSLQAKTNGIVKESNNQRIIRSQKVFKTRAILT